MVPVPYRVTGRRVETRDTATLLLEPVGARVRPFAPGQFAMLGIAGIGEVAVSMSGPDDPSGRLQHTVRDVGAVSRALHGAAPGQVIGVRGPFGRGWPLPAADGRDLLVVAGGVGLAPLRPVLLAVLAGQVRPRRVRLVAGARTPGDVLFSCQLATWPAAGVPVELTVDQPAAGWAGSVGFVTEPLRRLALDPGATVAFLCGPEPMLRFGADVLTDRGVPGGSIHVSLERNMQCGIGLCGHCQLGPLLLCRDGPVVDQRTAGPLLAVREL